MPDAFPIPVARQRFLRQSEAAMDGWCWGQCCIRSRVEVGLPQFNVRPAIHSCDGSLLQNEVGDHTDAKGHLVVVEKLTSHSLSAAR